MNIADAETKRKVAIAVVEVLFTGLSSDNKAELLEWLKSHHIEIGMFTVVAGGSFLATSPICLRLPAPGETQTIQMLDGGYSKESGGMRELAYANSAGMFWPEESWLKARMWTQGLTKEAAAIEIEKDITDKKLIVREKS